ncbi:pectate lyase-like adhesive domain-containing protein [Romboutsia lituseburensis]|uniref:Putative cell wall binding repeat-containing protein n=2 Tax=Romboutsia lituseburensis DSM 797 TaxID=1121325 RepID=A0A1G9UQ47_9FIRM|nr:pectate lyase-like adhesive domain-containing protein [Romboutsia lituseburensis]SDM61957.1 Putative cell wall binding repeat-containing protein [Romboutsia lituseburensis DSM 797]
MTIFKKYIVLVLSILSLGICIGPVKSTYALESNDNYKIEREATKKTVVEVSTEDELISALEDTSVKQVIMINDITISKKENARVVNIVGRDKEIIGKSTKDKFMLTTSFKDVKFKSSDSGRSRLHIKNITMDNVEIYDYYGKIESCTIKNAKIGIDSLENSNLTNTTITYINSKLIDVDIDNTNLDLKEGEASITVEPYSSGSPADPSRKLILKNIRIRNKEGHTLKVEGHYRSPGTDIFLEGDIILETNKDEAILLINENNELYVNGNLQQIGNTYTIKSEQDDHYNKIYDKNNILSKGKDSSGTGYYNTKQRIGEEPKLPNASEGTVSVSTEDELILALKNSSVQTIIMLNDITISKEENKRIDTIGLDKELIGKSTINKPILTTRFDETIFRGVSIKNITTDKIQIEVSSGSDKIENCTIKNAKSVIARTITNSIIENSEVNVNNLENSKLVNTKVGTMWWRDAKITNTDIDNTNLDLKENESSIYYKGSKSIALKNVKVRNKNGNVLKIEGKSEISLEGDIIVETTDTEAILVDGYSEYDSSPDKFLKLYINGNLQQIGNTYTIKAKHIGELTKIYDKNNLLDFAGDKDGTGYYNTKNRIGSAPELPKDGKQGWQYENNIWYFYKDGIKQKGWQNIYGTWYYFDEYYRMKTGWQNVYGVWYYLENSGAMATGWKHVYGAWYYLKNSGAMATGWENVYGVWYYLENSGAMATGWKSVNGTWYYLKNSGAMATGWQMISGKWYYLYSSGAMAKNTVIDGWKINSSGVATKIK